jgi:hypothetical protein
VVKRNGLIQAVSLAQVNAMAKKYYDPARTGRGDCRNARSAGPGTKAGRRCGSVIAAFSY